MAYDIINAIIDTMTDPNTGIKNLVNEGLISTNPIYLRTIDRPPLQDDPTRRSYYLCVGPEITGNPDDHYRMPVSSVRRGKLGMGTELPQHELNGAMRFINFFTIEGWTPRAASRVLVYEQGMEALARLEMALFKLQHSDFFYGIETEDQRESTGSMMQAFGYDGGRFTPLGGDSEWYGRIHIRFHIYSELQQAWFRGEEF